MVDWDHYKNAYIGVWGSGNRRERLVAQIIEELGFDVQLKGLGAGSTELISGRATEHGKKKADPDLLVTETGTHIEVTGTNVEWVRPDKTIRVRPDKFENSLGNPGKDYWLVHVLDGPALLRTIELTEAVCLEFQDQGQSINTRHDTNETYVEVPHNHDSVQSITALLRHLAPGQEDEFELATKKSLYRWTAAEDIEDKLRHSIALKLTKIDEWDSHNSIARRLHFVDCNNDEVIMTIFEGSKWSSASWETEKWYFFRDLEGDIYNGDPYLIPTTDSDRCLLSGDYISED